MSVHSARLPIRASLPFALLLSFLVVLWFAGGASRGDVSGQIVVRACAWLTLGVSVLFVTPPREPRLRPVALLVGATTIVALLQLVPLPPSIWQALPGRTIFAEAAAASGQVQPWRPWAIVPWAAANAASSLIVPVVVLFLTASLTANERALLPGVVLCLVCASMLVGLLKLIGAGFDNPFVNDSVGQVAGNFANRNHFALFLALGLILAPVWAYRGGRLPGWRGPMAAAMGLLLVLTILASGSRAGLLVGVIGLCLGLVIVQRGIRQSLSGQPRRVVLLLVGSLVVIGIVLAIATVSSDRAVSITRLVGADMGDDMRSRGLPVVMTMIREYFPAGAGLGGFDPLFRQHEPFHLLKLTYFNHAHDDWLEVVLDTGLIGVLLQGIALLWWGRRSLEAWRRGGALRYAVPKLGSATLLLVFIASLLDYPARTPLMMAIIVLAACWLTEGYDQHRSPALPDAD
ncbi:O-antigen ligase family protein [Sphingomonas sp. RIT328]|uniref:O-antigen ligase family protein n=1 Tax=Sphingomonas sp. RIT328 TaxID=1470591 RepID=UPI0004458309|nr:O-antigen ligase family protein [Sphingomonas sp. RIT328]EZP55125.1 O-antigen polymerase precursor [Sphingomonas sp. RIT328]